MNYRHGYHAGNFADVFKHIVMVRLLQALRRKDAGFVYLETHAGAGRYDLQGAEAVKSGEFRDGIGRLWDGLAGAEDYLALVRAANADGNLLCYPGSPRIARGLLRTQDRMRLAERSPSACAELQAEFARDKQVQVQCGDGYELLKAWIPPAERRGLALIDPAYEQHDEWKRLRAALNLFIDRWPQGVCAIWYPLKSVSPLSRFKSDLAASGLRRLLLAELLVWPPDAPFRLNGCGMLIYNPPWQVDAELAALLPELADRLGQAGAGRATVEWLAPE